MRWLGRRLLHLVVGVFAVLGFCCVPLGGRSALEHGITLVRSPSVVRAGQTFAVVATGIHHRLAEELALVLQPAATTATPAGSASATPSRGR